MIRGNNYQHFCLIQCGFDKHLTSYSIGNFKSWFSYVKVRCHQHHISWSSVSSEMKSINPNPLVRYFYSKYKVWYQNRLCFRLILDLLSHSFCWTSWSFFGNLVTTDEIQFSSHFEILIFSKFYAPYCNLQTSKSCLLYKYIRFLGDLGDWTTANVFNTDPPKFGWWLLILVYTHPVLPYPVLKQEAQQTTFNFLILVGETIHWLEKDCSESRRWWWW